MEAALPHQGGRAGIVGDPATMDTMSSPKAKHLTAVERAQLVAAAEHSGEMEGLHITSATRADACDYVDGKLTADELMARILSRWGD